MSELREKMVRKMVLRSLADNTQRSYLQSVSGLAKHYMKPPDQLTKEMIEDYLIFLKQEKGKARHRSKILLQSRGGGRTINSQL
jgi:hypothetical protein